MRPFLLCNQEHSLWYLDHGSCLIRVMDGEDNWRKLSKLNLHSQPTLRLGRREKVQKQEEGSRRGDGVVKPRKFGEILRLGEKSFTSSFLYWKSRERQIRVEIHQIHSSFSPSTGDFPVGILLFKSLRSWIFVLLGASPC